MTNDARATSSGTSDEAPELLRRAVREKYGLAAREASERGTACCGPSSDGARDPITANLYEEEDAAYLPDGALSASLGCGNPTALAQLREGEHVLDLGSGGGVDVLLSARRVGPTGRAYGVDMTDDMLELARRNAREAGVENVEFRKGEIEDLPLPDASVDVVISNCVINLSADKPRALAEAFRVLRPGGRFAVSDVVVRGPVPDDLRASMEAWIGCTAGALEEREYRRLLADVGFEAIEVEPTRVYDVEDAHGFLAGAGLDPDQAEDELADRFVAAFVRARKPGA